MIDLKEKTAKTLDDWIREMETYASSIYDFSKKFADIYEREELGKRREEHEQRHEAQKRDKPKVGEVYRDIFGNSYIVIGINDEEPFKKSFVTLIYFNAKAELRSSEVFTVPLEDFMNPTFKKI